MRRVVTGEELAQLYNPDPFAMPRWRAPVYRTPFGIILVAKFFKLLAWIDPADRPASAGRQRPGADRGDLGQARLGHPGRPGPGRRRHAGRLAVVLAGLVLPVGRPPGPGQVAGLVLPAPLGRGHDDCRGGAVVSGPDPAARARQGHRHPVHRPGICPAGLRPVRGRLRRSRGEPGARVRRAAVPGPHRPVRRGGAGVHPPGRPGRPRPRPPDPRQPRSQGAAGRPPRGRAALAGQTPRDARPDRGRDRGGQGLAAVGAGPGHVPAHARPAWSGSWPPTRS